MKGENWLFAAAGFVCGLLTAAALGWVVVSQKFEAERAALIAQAAEARAVSVMMTDLGRQNRKRIQELQVEVYVSSRGPFKAQFKKAVQSWIRPYAIP